MEPRVQYAKTRDGVDVAFATVGEGPPLLITAPPLVHVQGRWEVFAHLYQPLAAHFHLVWYDSRGCGLSDRDAIDFSMDAMIRDLEAVVEAAGLTGFAMAAFYDGVPIAVTYAASCPDKVRAMILAEGWTRFSDYQGTAYPAEQALRSGDWTVYTESFARVFIGLKNQELAGRFAAYIRESIAPEAWRLANSREGYGGWDVSGHLPHVTAPTLVVHNRTNRLLPVQAGQRLAARIPNARFQVVDDMDRLHLAGIITTFLTSEIKASRPVGLTEAGVPGLAGKRNSDGGSPVLRAAAAGLSPRETEVLRLLAAGKSSREIGEELVLAVRTVERHITNVYRKIGAHNRAQATAFALEHGLTDRS
jgi:DNA-binding CsgD family transcriptional regulator/pimeloyl-ACP methyl ester carboxylesterase